MLAAMVKSRGLSGVPRLRQQVTRNVYLLSVLDKCFFLQRHRRFTSGVKQQGERVRIKYDVVIVGAGPAGLSCATRLKQRNSDLSVCVVEKGAEVGSHILSGNCLETRALDELFPNWKEMDTHPIKTKVIDDKFRILTEKQAIHFPSIFMPGVLNNLGNYVVSLGAFCKWLANQAEALGVEIYPGFSAKSLVLDHTETKCCGVRMTDVGVNKDGTKNDSFQPGMELLAKQTVLAEGCRGSLSEEAMKRFTLRGGGVCPQVYGLGLKEVWEIDPSKHKPGTVIHTVGWPLGILNYGGSFMYHAENNLVYFGLVVGLDYRNPYLNPYEEFQRLKLHPSIRNVLEGGRCISYGARCLNEGGFQAIPKLAFKGGMLIGCGAGFLNVPKIKGTHTAMKSGMIAADCISDKLGQTSEEEIVGKEIKEFDDAMRNSWLWREMHQVRNSKPAFKGSLMAGMAYTGTSLLFLRGKEPWTFTWKGNDSDSTEEASKHNPIKYPKRVKGLSFDLLENLARSGTNHEENQPSHLQVRAGYEDIPVDYSLMTMGGPESRFCPAAVYEYGPTNDGDDPSRMRLQINSQNCLHCKCCAIKTPKHFINWTVPQGGGGPAYENM